MAQILGQWFFTQNVGDRAFGWTEQHYLTTAQDLPAALTDMFNLAQLRRQLLGAGVAMAYTRVSDREVYRDSQVTASIQPAFQVDLAAPNLDLLIIPAPPGTTNAAVGLYNPALRGEIQRIQQASELLGEYPVVSVLLRLEAGAPYVNRAQLHLRGFPDSVYRSDLSRPAAGPWRNALAAYENALIGQGVAGGSKYGFRTLLQPPDSPSYFCTGVTWTQSADTPPLQIPVWQLAALNPAAGPLPNWGVGTRVRVRGVTISTLQGSKIKVQGTFVVGSNVNGAVTFLGQALFTRYPVLVKGGTFIQNQYRVAPYTKVFDHRWGSRKTGGPFDRPRGRARPRQGISTLVDP